MSPNIIQLLWPQSTYIGTTLRPMYILFGYIHPSGYSGYIESQRVKLGEALMCFRGFVSFNLSRRRCSAVLLNHDGGLRQLTEFTMPARTPFNYVYHHASKSICCCKAYRSAWAWSLITPKPYTLNPKPRAWSLMQHWAWTLNWQAEARLSEHSEINSLSGS